MTSTIFKLAVIISGLTVTAMAQAQTCNEATADDFYADQDWHAENSVSATPDGRYPEDGGVAPFATIQELIDAVQPGDCGFVRASTSPYVELGRKSGTDYSGNTFIRGGTSEDQRIIIAGYPGERPVISANQQYDSVGRAVAGFFVFGGDHITIRNFQITGTTAPGIYTHPQEPNTDIIIENNYIHHIYGEENIGGVRIDKCISCIVRGNTIHDIYDTRTHATTSNPITSEPYGMHSGVHGYYPENSIIENNHIYHVGKAIYQKEPNHNGANSNEVRYNIIENVSDAAYYLQNAGSGGAPALNAKFHHNLVRNAPIAVLAEMYEATTPSTGFEIHNNTLVNVNSLYMLQRVQDVDVFDNLIYNQNFKVGVKAAFIFTNTQTTDKNEVAYSDHNLLYGLSNLALIDRYTADNATYSTLAGWQTATSSTSILPAGRDSSTLTQAPQFTDPDNGDYELLVGSPGDAAGRFGGDIGAFGNGFVIGPGNWSKRPRFEGVTITVD